MSARLTRGRLLVLTRHPPLPDFDGAGAYLWDLVAYFSDAGVKVEIASTWAPGDWQKAGWVRLPEYLDHIANLQFPNVLSIGPWRFFQWGSFKARSMHYARSLFRQTRRKSIFDGAEKAPSSGPQVEAPHWWSLPSPAETRFFGRRIARFRPDAVLANFCWLAPALPSSPAVRTAVLAHDVMSVKLPLADPATDAYPNPLNPATRAGEAALLKQAGTVLAISEDDALRFRSMLSAHAEVIVATKAAAIVSRPPASAPVRGRVLLVGSRNPPNCEGLRWLVSEIWPTVHARLPWATLHVCGDVAGELTATSAQIVARGRMPDLSPEYFAAEVVVVPLLRGTGVKIKLVEAASHGCPIVTTPVGLQGLANLRSAVCEAATADAFSEHIISLLSDSAKRSRLSESILNAVRAHLSPEACYGPALAGLLRR